MNERSARALLGVSLSATTGQIKRAYRRLALDAHPDRGGNAADFQRLVNAQSALLAGNRTAAAASARRQWIGESTARRTMNPKPTRIGDVGRRPAQRPSAPSRCFGDVLAEKLAAA